MGLSRCARCGRERPGETVGPSGAPLLLPSRSPGAWACLQGEDLCPDCQTPEERREAAGRLVARIQAEIQRRQGEGIASDPYEAALIAYAMTLRDEAANFGAEPPSARKIPASDAGARASEDVLTGVEAGPSAGAALGLSAEGGTPLCVAFTGAFLTGHPLTVHFDTYGELQRQLRGSLKGPGWRIEDLGREGGTYASGGGFSKGVPLVIARREGADLLPWLSSLFDSCGWEASSLQDFAPLLAARPKSLSVDVYDLGVAVITAWFDIVTATDVDGAATARAVKRLAWLRPGDRGRSPLADALQVVATSTAQQYGDAVLDSAPKELQEGWLSRSLPGSRAGSVVDRADEGGRLLWLHPVHVQQTRDRAVREARALAPAFHRTVKIEGGVFAAGIGSSVVVASPRSESVSTTVRLTRLHWAYYALYMQIDRGLLHLLNHERWSAPTSLKQMEYDAEDVFADYLRVMDARARLDSALSELGGDELAIWENIAVVQRFDALVEGVNRKLDVLEKLAERRVAQANAYRTRRINEILGLLTVLTVVTVTGGIIGLVFGAVTGQSFSVEQRIAAVAAATLLAVLLWVWAFVWTTRRPARRRRSGQGKQRTGDAST